MNQGIPTTNPLPTRQSAAGAAQGVADPRPTALIAAGSGALGVLERIRRLLQPLTGRLLGSGAVDSSVMAAQIRSFELEADVVMSRHKTQRAQLIVRAAIAVIVVLVVWASSCARRRGDAR